jgi:flagellar motor switch protein FliM
MPKKSNPFSWNETIQKLTSDEFSVQPIQHEIIRVDLTMEEIERLRNGEVIQTHLPWLQISMMIGG